MMDTAEIIALGIVLILAFVVAILTVRRFLKGRKNKNSNSYGMEQSYPTEYLNPNIEQQNPIHVQRNPLFPNFLTWVQFVTSLKENVDKISIRANELEKRVNELEKNYDLLLKSTIPTARKGARKVFDDFKKEDKKIQVEKIKEEKKKIGKITKKIKRRK